MPLRSLGFADLSRLGTQVATTSGHTCPYLAGKRDIQRPRATRMSLLSAFIRDCALALSLHSRRCARWQTLGGRYGLRSQPVRSAPERKRDARHISVRRDPCLPLVLLLNLWFGERL